jgi:hypothetical protein
LCISSNDPATPEVAVSLTLMVEQGETFLYLPAVLKADTTSASPPFGVLLGGLILMPAIVIGWRKRK